MTRHLSDLPDLPTRGTMPVLPSRRSHELQAVPVESHVRSYDDGQEESPTAMPKCRATPVRVRSLQHFPGPSPTSPHPRVPGCRIPGGGHVLTLHFRDNEWVPMSLNIYRCLLIKPSSRYQEGYSQHDPTTSSAISNRQQFSQPTSYKLRS
jgi:hypothetical protein